MRKKRLKNIFVDVKWIYNNMKQYLIILKNDEKKTRKIINYGTYYYNIQLQIPNTYLNSI